MKRETKSLKGQLPVYTPWGLAQLVRRYAEGVDFYTTSGHGGFKLSQGRIDKMPHPLGFIGPWAGMGWYEEDCDWSLVALSFPDLFDDVELYYAADTLLRNTPDHLKGADVWLESPAAKPLRDRIDAWFAINGDKFRLDSWEAHGTKAGSWSCRASTFNRERVLCFTMHEMPPFEPFTREEIEALGATIDLDKRKDEVTK